MVQQIGKNRGCKMINFGKFIFKTTTKATTVIVVIYSYNKRHIADDWNNANNFSMFGSGDIKIFLFVWNSETLKSVALSKALIHNFHNETYGYFF